MDDVKKVFLYGVILGITFIVIGFATMGFFIIKIGFASLGWLVPVIGFFALGSWVLWESLPAFIPIKQQIATEQSCSYCGAIVAEDATVCEKCKQPLENN